MTSEMKLSQEKGTLEGAEILFGFLGWLTSRYQITTFSRRHEASTAVELLKRFCEANGLPDECREDWDTRLTHPEVLPGEVENVVMKGPRVAVAAEVTRPWPEGK